MRPTQMRRSILAGAAALGLTLAVGGCSVFPVACSLEANAYHVQIDAGDAPGIEACVKNSCASSFAVETAENYDPEQRVWVDRRKGGTFVARTEFSPPLSLTISTLNADGTPSSAPKRFPLDWSSQPGACGWGPATTDPITF